VLAFTSVYFFESGLFNGLRNKKIKKLFPFHTTAPKKSHLLSASIAPARGAGAGYREQIE
jgi:hypothetical protein